MRGRIKGVILAAAIGMAQAAPAWAAPVPQGMTERIGPGAVVALRGTPHLWVADAQGVLHWAGDTRALAGRTVDWGSHREASLDEIRALRRGDPWLSAGLLQLGEPIYLVKWEADLLWPTLLHIQAIADVELFGINAGNYGQLVMDRGTWEQRFGIATGVLTKGVLPPAVAPGAGAGTATPTRTAVPAR
jgi:hypothetical protein